MMRDSIQSIATLQLSSFANPVSQVGSLGLHPRFWTARVARFELPASAVKRVSSGLALFKYLYVIDVAATRVVKRVKVGGCHEPVQVLAVPVAEVLAEDL